MSKEKSTEKKEQALRAIYSDLTPEDRETYVKASSDLWLYSKPFGLGTAAIGGIAAAMAIVTGNDALANRNSLMNAFKPAATPAEVILPPQSSPLYKYIAGAIEDQKPPSISVNYDFNYAQGKYSAKPADADLPARDKPIDVKRFNYYVTDKIESENNSIDAKTGYGALSFLSFAAAAATVINRKKPAATIKSLYVKYLDTDKTAPSPN